MNKLLKCTYCKNRQPRETMIKTPVGNFCDFDHATKYAQAKSAKKATAKLNADIKHEKMLNRKAKDNLKTKSDWLKEAQKAINTFVRTRDSGLPCCSCDKPDNGNNQRHASHYRSVKACSTLRFNLFNINASCAQCNTMLSGNLLEYRIRLIKKIGEKRVKWLECKNEIARYDIDYLKRIKIVFNKRTRLYNLRRI